MARTVEHFGPPDILVNNAGIFVAADSLELTDDEWQRCMSVDLEAVWWLTRAVLPHMIDRGGAIVNIASTHSYLIVPGCCPYPLAKHARGRAPPHRTHRPARGPTTSVLTALAIVARRPSSLRRR